MHSVLRQLQSAGQYLVEALLLCAFGIHRIIAAWISQGDVYDAKVIFAGDISDLGGHRLAIRWLSRLITAYPDRPRAYSERGHARFNLSDSKGAMEDFAACLRIDPEFPGAKQWYLNASNWPPKVA